MSRFAYYDQMTPILQRAFETQEETLLAVSAKMADTIASGHVLYAFGAGHAGIISEELFYRAGGLVPVNPIFIPGLLIQTRPATLETELERVSGIARLALDAAHIQPGDLLIVHSNSGRNTVAIEMAEEARARGVAVVALTSVAHSQSVASRHPKGFRLMDVADYVIDNCGVVGDALVRVSGVPQPVASTSTVVGAALMNALVAETARLMAERGLEPPIYRSANLDGSEDNNNRWMNHYRARLTYL